MYVLDHPIIIGIVITLLSILFGLKDLARFSLRRIEAIASVCFAESIRRKILLLAPIAIIGVIVVAQLQKATDPQDTIRVTTKYCLFASGLIVVAASLLLACTNLPKEIENRVIYTVVTKPTTRLEIVLGKIAGFSVVSAAILLIMGGFTWSYLHLQSASLMSRIQGDLNAGALDPGLRTTLEHYQQAGLLSTKSLELPSDLLMSADIPEDDDISRVEDAGALLSTWQLPDPLRTWWIAGGQAHFVSAPFSLTKDEQTTLEGLPNSGPYSAYVSITLRVKRRRPSPQDAMDVQQSNYVRDPVDGELTPGPSRATTQASRRRATDVKLLPQIGVQIVDDKGKVLPAPPISLEKFYPEYGRNPRFNDPLVVVLPISPDVLARLAKMREFTIEAQAQTPTIVYGANVDSIRILIQSSNGTGWIQSRPWTGVPVKPWPNVFSRVGKFGMQLRGEPDWDPDFDLKDATTPGGPTTVPSTTEPSPAEAVAASTTQPGGALLPGHGGYAVFRFMDAPVPHDGSGKVSLQVKASVEHVGTYDVRDSHTNEMTVQVVNHTTGERLPEPIILTPETGRISYVDVPVSVLEGGNFDVLLHGKVRSQTIGLAGPNSTMPAVTMATADHSFEFNLLKSLLILWMLSVLVIIISVFCSTFLSWPIAIVLTVMLLLGRWGVDALGDSLAPGQMRSVSTDLFGAQSSPYEQRAVTETLETLTDVLRKTAKVLPDVAAYPAFEDIQRGVDIRLSKLIWALAESAAFGIPLILLTYQILKRKEVAP